MCPGCPLLFCTLLHFVESLASFSWFSVHWPHLHVCLSALKGSVPWTTDLGWQLQGQACLIKTAWCCGDGRHHLAGCICLSLPSNWPHTQASGYLAASLATRAPNPKHTFDTTRLLAASPWTPRTLRRWIPGFCCLDHSLTHSSSFSPAKPIVY